MFVAKTLILASVAALAIIVGGMAAAWRRACVMIARTVATSRWLSGEDGIAPPTASELSQQEIIRYTPSWVSARHILSLFLLFLTAILGLIFFGWYVGLATAVITYVLMELAGFIFPNRNSIYYVAQVHDSFLKSIQVAEQFRNEAVSSDFRNRLKEIEAAYRNDLVKQSDNG
jgi:hypothetical protein